MKRLIFYVFILIVAVWLGLFLSKDPGYLLISYEQWTIETSIWFGLACLLVTFLVLHFLWRLAYIIIQSKGHLLRWYRSRRFMKAHSTTGAGLLALAQGAFPEAENLLLRGVKHTNTPIINYLYAARAAQGQLNYKERDHYLEKALTIAEADEVLAVKLYEAKLYIEHQQYDSARLLLEPLQKENTRHRYTLYLLQQVYLNEKLWNKLAALLPLLKKRRVLCDDEFNDLETALMIGVCHDSSLGEDELYSYWKSITKSTQQKPSVRDCYIKRLDELHADKKRYP